jgi:hypothetical protein
MTMTSSNQKPGHQSDIDALPGDKDTPAGNPTPEDKAEAMEEAQKEGAEQREEGGYQ